MHVSQGPTEIQAPAGADPEGTAARESQGLGEEGVQGAEGFQCFSDVLPEDIC